MLKGHFQVRQKRKILNFQDLDYGLLLSRERKNGTTWRLLVKNC